MAAKEIERRLVAKGSRREKREGGVLLDAEVNDNGNIVLVFEDARVIMPGSWEPPFDLYTGQTVAAWWEPVETVNEDTGEVERWERFNLQLISD